MKKLESLGLAKFQANKISELSKIIGGTLDQTENSNGSKTIWDTTSGSRDADFTDTTKTADSDYSSNPN